jgi:hypothetical protein
LKGSTSSTFVAAFCISLVYQLVEYRIKIDQESVPFLKADLLMKMTKPGESNFRNLKGALAIIT